jgi:hypothetical protein
LLLSAFVAGCSSTPPPPDWKLNTVSLIDRAEMHWLEGDSSSAELALAKARSEIAKTGRLDLLARAELAACASHVAGLDLAPCKGFDARDAAPPELAYARFLAGDWGGLDGKLLPAHYAALGGAKDDSAANHAATEIADPLPRLIAIGLLFKQARAQSATMVAAVDTASAQGWRRPLLAWLMIEAQRAKAAGDTEASARLQRRIDFLQDQAKDPTHKQ